MYRKVKRQSFRLERLAWENLLGSEISRKFALIYHSSYLKFYESILAFFLESVWKWALDIILVWTEVNKLLRNMTEVLVNTAVKMKWLNKRIFFLCSLKCLERSFLRLAPVEESKSWNHAFSEMFCFVFSLLKWSPSTLRTSRYCLLNALCTKPTFQKTQKYFDRMNYISTFSEKN